MTTSAASTSSPAAHRRSATTRPLTPTDRVHGLPGVGLAAFLGTPIAGGLIIADNFRRLGHTGAAVTSVAVGAVATAALLGGFAALGDSVPPHIGTLVALALAMGARKIATHFFGAQLDAIEDGSMHAISAWAGASVGLAFAAVFLACALLL